MPLLPRCKEFLRIKDVQVASVEFSLIEASVMHGLKQGNEVLQQIHKEMSIDDVQKLMDETREAIEYQKEIDEMLSSKMNADEEEEVMAELAALQAELVCHFCRASVMVTNQFLGAKVTRCSRTTACQTTRYPRNATYCGGRRRDTAAGRRQRRESRINYLIS